MSYQSDLRNKNRGYMNLIVSQKAMDLFEKLETKRDDGDWMNRIAEDAEEYSITPTLHHSNTPFARAFGAAAHA